MTCDEINEIPVEFSAPCEIVDLHADLSAPTAEINSSNDLSAHINFDIDENESCEEITNVLGETCDVDKFGLDCVDLITHGVIENDPPINSLCYIALDSPMYLSHAMDKLCELTISKSFAVHEYTIHLIGQHDVNNNILVHEICITCDNFPLLGEKKFLHMLNHFDRTSNIGVDYLPNSYLHACLNISALTCSKFQHIVVTNLDTIHYYSPMLGWCNGERCKPNTRNRFAYKCKQYCQSSCWNVIHHDCFTNYLIRLCYKRSIVQERRCIKMDDIYIYHAHTLSILSVSLQHKRRRGRLSFQEREDDMDMITMDTTITNLIIGVFNNNSN